MPTVEVDRTGLICITALVVSMILSLAWLVYYLHTALKAMHKKVGDVEMQQMMVATSPAPDGKCRLQLSTTASTKAHDLSVSKPVHIPMQRPCAEYRPCFEPDNFEKSSPNDWEFALVLPSNAQSSPLELYYRAMTAPERSQIGLVHHRIDHERTVVRIRLMQSQEKQIEAKAKSQDSGGFICCRLGAGGPYPYPPDTWIHVRE